VKLDLAVIEELAVHPGDPAGLGSRSTSATSVDWLGAKGGAAKEVATADLQNFVDDLRATQELLFATGTHAVLIVLQAMDAAGKDGTVKHVMSGVNPQGSAAHAFKEPSAEERDHDFLWRYGKLLPGRGRIAIINRSYYEEVLMVRVHPELLAPGAGAVPDARDQAFWQYRYDDINAFEHHLHRNREVFSEPLSRRAEAETSPAARRPGQELEVFGGRSGRTLPLEPIPGCLRGCSQGNVHAVGTVVCCSGRPQVRHARVGGWSGGSHH
jgi:hypothetical protein